MADDRHDASAPAALPAGALEDIADLQAELKAVKAELKALRELTEADHGDVGQGGEQLDGPESAEEDGWQYPPFILLLEGEEYANELRALAEWVEGVLVPGYLAEPSADAHWCHLWMEHDDAVAHLHALWLAWQELTDPATCGYTGPSVWHRDHYKPCIDLLRASTGPFQGCTKGEHQINHRLPGKVPSAWYQDED